MRSNSTLVGNLIDDLLEESTLSIFDGIYRFLSVLPKILEKLHFFHFIQHFMHLFG